MITSKYYLRIALLFIVSRVLFFFVIQPKVFGVVSPLAIMLCSNIKDIVTGWLILSGILPHFHKMNKNGRAIIKYVFIYLVTFSILMLYPLVPPYYFVLFHVRTVLWFYNCIWAVVALVLIGRYKFVAQ